MSHVFLIAPLLRQFGVGLPIYLTISCLWPALWRILLAIFSKNFKSQLGNHWIISAMFIFTSIWKVHQLVEHEGLTVPVDRVCSDYKAHLSFIDYGSDHEIFKRLQVPFNLRRASYIHTIIWRTPLSVGWKPTLMPSLRVIQAKLLVGSVSWWLWFFRGWFFAPLGTTTSAEPILLSSMQCFRLLKLPKLDIGLILGLNVINFSASML